MSRTTALAPFLSFAHPLARWLAIGVTLLCSGLASAQTLGETPLEDLGFEDWSAVESESGKTQGFVVEPPPPERFLPESDCPIVEGEPRCVYVVHHDRHSWAAWTTPDGIRRPSGYETHLRVDARNFSGRPAEIDVLAFDTNGGFRDVGVVSLASGRAASLPSMSEALETLVVVSDTRLRLAAHVETRRRIDLPPSPSLCLPGLDGIVECNVTPPVVFEPIDSHHAPATEVDCEQGRGDAFLCRALRYLP